VRVAHEAALAVPPERLWALLWDVRRMVACVPGCEEAQEVESRRRYRARMRQKVGMVALAVTLDVTVTAVEAPRRLALEARGRDPLLGAEIDIAVRLEITPRDGQCLLRVDGEGRVLGKLGSLGQGVIQRKADEVVAEFAVRLGRAAET